MVGVLRDMMDRVFRTVSQVEQLLRVSCLASIPAVEPDKNFGCKLRYRVANSNRDNFWALAVCKTS